jgi:8-oxo-dGTP pyrophosphatase MutT (NUDIX family)
MTEPNPWTTLSTREAYANPWIRVREDQIINPSGGRGIYGVVEYKKWEIPEGGCPPGESPEDCARRELLEETGLIAATIEPLLTGLQLSNSTTNEVCDLFVARGITQGVASPEETEKLSVKRVPLSEAIAMAKDGRIKDSPSVLALLALALK